MAHFWLGSFVSCLILWGISILTGISTKKIDRWQISTWQDVPHPTSSGKYKLKQWHATTYLVGWPKSRTMWVVGKNMEYQELLFIANGNINSTVTLKDDLVVSYKTKHIFPIRQQSRSLVFTQRRWQWLVCT